MMKRTHRRGDSPSRKRNYLSSGSASESSAVFNSSASNNHPRKALLSRPSPDVPRSRRDNFSSRGLSNNKNYAPGRINKSVREPLVATSSRSTALNPIGGRIDPMLAAATAAAAMVNLGLAPPTSTDLSGFTQGTNSSTASAVAALAINAAAMAAALGLGGSGSASKSLLPNASSRSVESSTSFRRISSFSGARDSSSKNQWISKSTREPRAQHSQRQPEQDQDNSHGRFPHHLDHRNPEDDPTATRTLFVGNLMPEITEEDLRSIFERYGFIEDIDIKRRDPESGINAFAFIRFINLDMAHRAKVDMSGQLIGQFTCKIGYGKVVPTRCLWIGGLGPWITYPSFATLLGEFGPTEKIIWPSGKNYANVLFPTVEQAILAADALRGYPLGGPERRIRVDFTDESHMSRDPLKRRKVESRDLSRHADRATHMDSFSPRATFDHSNNGDHRANKREYRSILHTPSLDRQQSIQNESRRKFPRQSRNATSKYDSPRSVSSDFNTTFSRRHSRSPKQKNDMKSMPPRSSALLTLQSAVTVDDLASCLPIAWTGAFFLKSSSFPCRMHMLCGDQSLVDQFMSSNSLPTSTDGDNLACLRITQRMKLDPLKLDDVSQRINTAGNAGFCVLLAVPSSVFSLSHESHSQGAGDVSRQPQRPLRNLISYLRTKDSAGVVILNPPSNSLDSTITGVLHAFPPCDFAFSLLKERAVALIKDTGKDDHLVILLIRSASPV